MSREHPTAREKAALLPPTWRSTALVRGSGDPLPRPSPEEENRRSDHKAGAVSERCHSEKGTINRLNWPWLVMSWGSRRKVTGVRTKRDSAAWSHRVSCDCQCPCSRRAFGRSAGNWFCWEMHRASQCPVASTAVTWRERPGWTLLFWARRDAAGVRVLGSPVQER